MGEALMPEAVASGRFIEALSPSVRQAAAIARALEGQVANEPKTGEPSAVKAALTIADTAVQEALLVTLLQTFPNVVLSAEEETPSVDLFEGNGPGRVVIDPIDGTLHSFLEGRGPYATIIGLADDRGYQASIVALPREGIFFDATRGGGVFRARARAQRKQWTAERNGARVLVHHEMPDIVTNALREKGYEVVYGCGGAVSIAPMMNGFCGGLRIAPETISIRGRVGLLIAREGGAVVTTETGAPFPLGLDEPARGLVLAVGDEDHRALREAVQLAF